MDRCELYERAGPILVCVNPGRWEAGAWSVVQASRNTWELRKRNHSGARGEALLDCFPSFSEAAAAHRKERAAEKAAEQA